MIHKVKSAFRAYQYPGAPMAIGVKWSAIKDKDVYRFQLQGRPRTFYIDVQRAIAHAKHYPPKSNPHGFLHLGRCDMLIVPEDLWEVKEETQGDLFK